MCFVHFWLQNVLRAAAFFDIAISKSGPTRVCFVHFDFKMCFAPQRRAIFHLSSGQLAPHPPLSKPTFRPSGATNHWKNTMPRDFPTFSRICIFCPLTFSLLLFSLLIFLFSLPLPSSAFYLSILSEVRLLNFLRICTLNCFYYLDIDNLLLYYSYQSCETLLTQNATVGKSANTATNESKCFD